MKKIQFLPSRGRFKSLIQELKKFNVQCSLVSCAKYSNFFALPTINFINSINADVFVSSNPYYGLFAASLAKKKGNLDYSVLRLKGDYWTELKYGDRTVKNKFGGYVKKIENLVALKNVDFILAISNWIKLKAENKGLHNIHVLYNGVDINRFRPRKMEPGYKSQLLCVMNFNIYQKIIPLYDFLNEYKKRNMPYQITFLGTGLYLNSIKKHAYDVGLTKQVKFKGWVKNAELYYSNCDVLIHPSGLEAFGMAPLEAGSCSKPVIATKVGGIPEVVIDGETGLLTNDIDQFVDYVEDLIADANRREKLGMNARRRILANFTWEIIAKRFVDILEEEGLFYL